MIRPPQWPQEAPDTPAPPHQPGGAEIEAHAPPPAPPPVPPWLSPEDADLYVALYLERNYRTSTPHARAAASTTTPRTRAA